MIVNATANLEVDIDKFEQKEIAEKFIKETFDIPTNGYIDEKGNLMFWWEEGGGTHSWTEQKKVRKATEFDRIYFEFIDMLNELWNKKNTTEK